MSDRAARIHAWLALVRPPNLPTVPGDPLAGFALAAVGCASVDWRAAGPVAAAALLLYAAGLIWNDCADAARDRVRRGTRPLPSGRVRPRHAALAGTLLAGLGLGSAALAGAGAAVAALGLLALILAYDFGPRRFGRGRALAMGACRGMSLVMGALAARPVDALPATVFVAAAGVTALIAVVTWIARRETETVRIGSLRWAPAAAGLVLYAALLPLAVGRTGGVFQGAAVVSLGLWVRHGVRLRGRPDPDVVGRSIGGMIRAMIPLQAALCALGAGGGTTAGGLLLLGWPVSAGLARRFYAS